MLIVMWQILLSQSTPNSFSAIPNPPVVPKIFQGVNVAVGGPGIITGVLDLMDPHITMTVKLHRD